MPPAPARRSDAGTVKLTGRDITGLVLCAEHFGAAGAGQSTTTTESKLPYALGA